MNGGQGKASHFLGQHSWIAASANDSRMPSRGEVTNELKLPQAEALESPSCDLLQHEQQEGMAQEFMSIVQVSQTLCIPRMEVRRLMMSCALGEVTRNASGHLRVETASVEKYRKLSLTRKPQRRPGVSERELFWLYD